MLFNIVIYCSQYVIIIFKKYINEMPHTLFCIWRFLKEGYAKNSGVANSTFLPFCSITTTVIASPSL